MVTQIVTDERWFIHNLYRADAWGCDLTSGSSQWQCCSGMKHGWRPVANTTDPGTCTWSSPQRPGTRLSDAPGSGLRWTRGSAGEREGLPGSRTQPQPSWGTRGAHQASQSPGGLTQAIPGKKHGMSPLIMLIQQTYNCYKQKFTLNYNLFYINSAISG